MKLTFCGACRQVTGSCYWLEQGDTNIVIDCGMIQGAEFSAQDNYEPWPFDPKTIDYVFITHAHLDHTGRLPRLVQQGFRGKIIATAATLDFAELLLTDSARVLAQEAHQLGREPLYSEADVAAMVALFQPIDYHQAISCGSVTATWFDAGHILGSAFIRCTVGEQSIVFSGDLGNPPVPLLRPTDILPPTNYVVMESTYADRQHEATRERKLLLASAIYETVTMKGVLLIPAFAIERTQEILYELNSLVEHHDIPPVPIFIDSPLAIKATRLYSQYNHLFNDETKYIIASGDDVFKFSGLQFTESPDQSHKIDHAPVPKIIMAGSGMMQGGRIRHHLQRYLGSFQNQVLIVGYQVAGSLGRQLLDKAKRVTIAGHTYPVRAKIRAIGAYSAHADQPKLLQWLDPERTQPQQVWLTHGEVKQAEAFATILQQRHIHATVPNYGQVETLSLS